MSAGKEDVLARTGLPATENVSASIINDQILLGAYYKFLRQHGIIMKDIRTAMSEDKEKIDDVIRSLGLKEEILLGREDTGFYIEVPNNTRTKVPIYACFVIGKEGFRQRIINVINIGDSSEALIAKGCASIVPEGAHSAITLLRIGQNSKLTSLMIHNWAPSVDVASKTFARIGVHSSYKYYYVKLSPVRGLGLSTTIKAEEGASIEVHEATYAHRNTRINSSIEIELNGRKSKGLIITRGIVEEQGYLNSNLRIKSTDEDTVGHIECNGLVIGDGYYRTNPVLETTVSKTTLTHEASIGRISQDQLFYLQTRGLTEEEATRTVVLGFLSSTLTGLPPSMKQYMEYALKQLSMSTRGF